MEEFHLHLISDATGETVQSVARACLVQFENVKPTENLWTLVRTEGQLEKVIVGIKENPGFVLYTLVDPMMRTRLHETCQRIQVPCVSVLQPIMSAFGGYLNIKQQARPGRQHVLDNEYFARISSMDFAMSHDDGQSTWNLEEADVVLVGVSRTSKTPTCIYLANRGIKAANFPIILGMKVPEELFALKKPLVVGLIKETGSLVQIRRNRLRMLNEGDTSEYADPDTVAEEVKFANRIIAGPGWPVIDVTRRSIEETAASIMQMLAEFRQSVADTQLDAESRAKI
ncbi:MAG: pyruvate, water dikinase regulatory protein [Pseudomonadota bacterium]|nr:pyruvate, water dikinase regulatory protein [Pseudomonadota bacterium]